MGNDFAIFMFTSLFRGISSKEFASLGTNSFFLLVDPSLEGFLSPRKQTGTYKWSLLVKIILSIIPLKKGVLPLRDILKVEFCLKPAMFFIPSML